MGPRGYAGKDGKDGGKGGGREHAGDRALRIEGRFEVLGTGGVVVAVLDFVFTRPDHLDRTIDGTGDPRGFDREVGLGFTTKPTAQKSHVRDDVDRVNLQEITHRILHRLGVLGACPDFEAFTAGHRGGGRGFHGGVSEMRGVIVGNDAL